MRPAPSPWSIGLFMLALAVIGLMPPAGQQRPDTLAAIESAVLATGGVALLLRRPGGLFIALAAGVIAAGFGVAGFVLERNVGLPPHPAISLVAGLYVVVRVLIARTLLRKPPPAEAPPPGDDAG